MALLKGEGHYTDDFRIEGALHGFVLRSPYAHARFTVVSPDHAASLPGADLIAIADVRQDEATFPNGTHVVEVEIDPETGAMEIVNYQVVDDLGVSSILCCCSAGSIVASYRARARPWSKVLIIPRTGRS